MPEGDTIHYAANRIRPLLEGVVPDELRTPHRRFAAERWPERLAGAMESFSPAPPPGGLEAFIAYSPYCEPRLQDGVKGVFVDARLRDVEPMAWHFVMNFARDNDLVVVDFSKSIVATSDSAQSMVLALRVAGQRTAAVFRPASFATS